MENNETRKVLFVEEPDELEEEKHEVISISKPRTAWRSFKVSGGYYELPSVCVGGGGREGGRECVLCMAISPIRLLT